MDQVYVSRSLGGRGVVEGGDHDLAKVGQDDVSALRGSWRLFNCFRDSRATLQPTAWAV